MASRNRCCDDSKHHNNDDHWRNSEPSGPLASVLQFQRE